MISILQVCNNHISESLSITAAFYRRDATRAPCTGLRAPANHSPDDRPSYEAHNGEED